MAIFFMHIDKTKVNDTIRLSASEAASMSSYLIFWISEEKGIAYTGTQVTVGDGTSK